MVEELPAAYDNFVTLLGELPQNENQILKLRRLNYTKIELASIQIASEQMLEKRHVLYDVFIGKALSLLNAEIEMVKELFRYGNIIPELKSEIIKDTENKSVVMLTWNGTDSDLIELVAALMAAGAISSRNGDKLTVISVIRALSDDGFILCFVETYSHGLNFPDRYSPVSEKTFKKRDKGFHLRV